MEQEQPESSTAQIVNFPKTVPAFGKEYQVRELTLGPLIRALPHIAPLGYLMRSLTKADAADVLVNALALAGEPALGLISVVTEEPTEWLEDKDPVEALELLTEIVEASADYFFDSAKLERIRIAFARLGKVIEQHAPKEKSGTSSTYSSDTDTAH